MSTIQEELLALKNPERAEHSMRFFKTGAGQYGEGDLFLGLTVPLQRQIAKKHKDLTFEELSKLFESKYHEFRLCGCIILINQFQKSREEQHKNRIYNFLLKHLKALNNWDLIDTTVPPIIGSHILQNPELKPQLYAWAHSKNLWEKRIAMLATFAFIRSGDFSDAIKIAEILLNDTHDLIHKAVGWMMREAGNKNLKVLEDFLEKHHQHMPRTMLRYAIEKLPQNKRAYYMKKK